MALTLDKNVGIKNVPDNNADKLLNLAKNSLDKTFVNDNQEKLQQHLDKINADLESSLETYAEADKSLREYEAAQEDAFVSNLEANSVAGSALNTGASLLSGGVRIIGDVFSAPARLQAAGLESKYAKALEAVDVEQKAKAELDTINLEVSKHQKSGTLIDLNLLERQTQLQQGLTEATKYLDEQSAIGVDESVFNAGTGPTNRQQALEAINYRKAVEPLITITEMAQENASKLVNRNKQNALLEEVRVDAEQSAKSFNEGNYADAAITAFTGFAKGLVNNPGAATELFAESYPQMLLSAKFATGSTAVLFARNNDDITKEFIEVNKRNPTEQEKTVIGQSALIAAIADAASDKILMQGLPAIAGAIGTTAKAVGIPLEIVSKPFQSLVQRFPKTAKTGEVAGTTTFQPVQEFFSGATTEAATQYGVKQDADKLDTPEIFTQGIVEAIAVGPVQAARGAKALTRETVKGINQGAKVLVERAQEDVANTSEQAKSFYSELTSLDTELTDSIEALKEDQLSPEEFQQQLNDRVKNIAERQLEAALQAVEDVETNENLTSKQKQTYAKDIRASLEKARSLQFEDNFVQKVGFVPTDDNMAIAVNEIIDDTFGNTGAIPVIKRRYMFEVLLDESSVIDDDTVTRILGSKNFSRSEKRAITAKQKFNKLLEERANSTNKTFEEVRQEIFKGTDSTLGVKDYELSILLGLTSGNTDYVTKQATLLNNWVETQINKASAIDQVRTYNEEVRSRVTPENRIPLANVEITERDKAGRITKFKPLGSKTELIYDSRTKRGENAFAKLQRTVQSDTEALVTFRDVINESIATTQDVAPEASQEVTETPVPPVEIPEVSTEVIDENFEPNEGTNSIDADDFAQYENYIDNTEQNEDPTPAIEVEQVIRDTAYDVTPPPTGNISKEALFEGMESLSAWIDQKFDYTVKRDLQTAIYSVLDAVRRGFAQPHLALADPRDQSINYSDFRALLQVFSDVDSQTHAELAKEGFYIPSILEKEYLAAYEQNPDKPAIEGTLKERIARYEDEFIRDLGAVPSIRLDEFVQKGITEGNRNAYTYFLHEKIHIATSRFIQDNPTDSRVKRLKALFERAKRIAAQEPQLFTNASDYWQTNLEEFIAESLSNPELILALKSITLTGEKTSKLNNFFKALIDTIGNALGFSSSQAQTLYDSAVAGFAEIATAQAEVEDSKQTVRRPRTRKRVPTQQELMEQIPMFMEDSTIVNEESSFEPTATALDDWFNNTAPAFVAAPPEMTALPFGISAPEGSEATAEQILNKAEVNPAIAENIDGDVTVNKRSYDPKSDVTLITEGRTSSVLARISNFFESYRNNTLAIPFVSRESENGFRVLDKFVKQFGEAFVPVFEITDFKTAKGQQFSFLRKINNQDKFNLNPALHFFHMVTFKDKTVTSQSGTFALQKGAVDPNVMSAMAVVAFEWLATEASNTLYNNDYAIRKLMGYSDNQVIPKFIYEQLSEGMPRSQLADTLGKAFLKQFDAKLNPELVDHLANDRLVKSIGLHIIATLQSQGYINTKQVNLGKLGAYENDPVFVTLAYKGKGLNKQPTAAIELFRQSYSPSFFQQMFGIVRKARGPSFRPRKPLKSIHIGLNGEVGKDRVALVNKQRSVPWNIRKDKVRLLDKLSQGDVATVDFVKKLMGYNFDIRNNTPLAFQENVEAKNREIEREIAQIVEFYESYKATNNKDFYFDYALQDNIRMRVNGSIFNYQSTKLVRHLIYSPEWGVQKVSKSDPAVMHGLQEAFDKQFSFTSVTGLLRNKDIKAALAALKVGKVADPAVQNIVNDELQLDALYYLLDHSQTKGKLVTTQYVVEADAKTSGIILTERMFPSNTPESDQILRAGGFYTFSDIPQSLEEFAADKSNRDNYNRLIDVWMRHVTGILENNKNPKLHQLTHLIELNRDIAKVLVMPASYMAGNQGLIETLTEHFIKELSFKLVEAKGNPEQYQLLLDQINAVTNGKLTTELDLRTESLPKALEDNLRAQFTTLYGSTLETALEELQTQSRERAKLVNLYTNIAYAVFKFKFDKFINGISSKITEAQFRDEFQAFLEQNAPILEYIDASVKTEGYFAAKVGRKSSPMFSDINNASVILSGGKQSISAYVKQLDFDAPGVAAFVNGIQSLDAAGMEGVIKNHTVMSVFDAVLTPPSLLTETVNTYVRAIEDNASRYNMLDNAVTLMRTSLDSLRTKDDSGLLNEFISTLKDQQKNKAYSRLIKELKATKELDLTEATLADIEALLEAAQQEVDLSEQERSTYKLRLSSVDHMEFAPGRQTYELGIEDELAIDFTNEETAQKGLKKVVDNIVENIDKDENNGDTLGSTPYSRKDTFNAQETHELKADSVAQVYDNLEAVDRPNRVNISDTHDSLLRNVVNTLVATVMPAIDAYELRVRTIGSSIYAQIRPDNVIELTKNYRPVKTLVQMSAKEAYVHELAHLISKTGIADPENAITVRKLDQLMRRAKQELNKKYDGKGWKIFLHTDSDGKIIYKTNKAAEEKAAKEQFDYIFNNPKLVRVRVKVNGKTQDIDTHVGLHEFVAFGLTNEKLNDFLKTIPGYKIEDNRDGSLAAAVKYYFDKIVFRLARMFGSKNNVSGDKALYDMVLELNESHQLRLNMLDKLFAGPIDSLNTTVVNAWRKHVFAPLNRANLRRLTLEGAGPKEAVARLTFGKLIDPQNAYYSRALGEMRRRMNISTVGFVQEIAAEIFNANSLVFKNVEKILLRSRILIDQQRQRAVGAITGDLEAQFATPIDRLQGEALTRVFMRTGLTDIFGEINRKNYKKVISTLQDPSVRIKTAVATLSALGPIGNFYINQARGLGIYMAKGLVTVEGLGLNAEQIVRAEVVKEAGGQVPSMNAEERAKAKQAIDDLASLIAIQNTSRDMRNTAVDLINSEFEANKQFNGIQFFSGQLALHRAESLVKNFQGNEMLTTKGYVKNVFDKFMSFKVLPYPVSGEDAIALKKAGYTYYQQLPTDPNDPLSQTMAMYTNPVGGLAMRDRGVLAMSDLRAAGTSFYDGSANALSGKNHYIAKHNEVNKVSKNNKTSILTQLTTANYSSQSSNVLLPVRNEDGKTVDYRYVMSDETRTNLLNQEVYAPLLLGEMMAAIKEKQDVKGNNRAMIDALKLDFEKNFTKERKDFVYIGSDSTDPKIQQIYRMLPKDSRDYITKQFGKSFYVREEILESVFGRAKYSLAEALTTKTGGAKMAKLIELLLQELVQFGKRTIVIRFPQVLRDNVISNTLFGVARGVPPTYMMSKQIEGVRHIHNYLKDAYEQRRLENQLNARKDSLTASQRKDLGNQLSSVIGRINSNPIMPLIKAGLFQTIADEIELAEHGASFSDRYLEDLTDRLGSALNISRDKGVGKGLKTAVDFAYMGTDTAIYKFMSTATQYSDFVARYAVYSYKVKKGQEIGQDVSEQELLQQVQDMFINYETMTNSKLEYASSIGFVMFSKYPLRIVRALVTAFRENPVQMVALLAAQEILNTDAPEPMDSATSMLNIMSLPTEALSAAATPAGLRLLGVTLD